MNMWSNRRRRSGRTGRHPGRENDPIQDPLDHDYGFGYTEEGRPITGVTDGDVHDPQAEIFEPKGETMYVNLAEKKAVKMCVPDQHDLHAEGEPGEEIPGTQAMKCSRCPYGRLVPVS